MASTPVASVDLITTSLMGRAMRPILHQFGECRTITGML